MLEAKNISITVPEKSLDGKYIDDLFTILSRNRGNCEVFLSFKIDNEVSVKILSQPMRIQGSAVLEQELLKSGCQVRWNL